MEIRHSFTLALLCCTIGVQAQQSFTSRVLQRRSGDGVVVLHQDETLTALVNNLNSSRSGSTTGSTAGSGASAGAAGTAGGGVTSGTSADDARVETTEVDLGDGRKVYRNSIKMPGFRIQVYSGGNSRQAKQAAESMARRAKQYFPDQPVYTHFYSPRWICRIGDFRTIEEATEMLRQMKETGEFRQAVIVKSVVQIAL